MTVAELKEELNKFEDSQEVAVTLTEIDEYSEEIKVYKNYLKRVMIDAEWECNPYSLMLICEKVLERDKGLMTPAQIGCLEEFIEETKNELSC